MSRKTQKLGKTKTTPIIIITQEFDKTIAFGQTTTHHDYTKDLPFYFLYKPINNRQKSEMDDHWFDGLRAYNTKPVIYSLTHFPYLQRMMNEIIK